MAAPLSPLIKGKAPSMLDTATANRLISVINGLAQMKVTPDGFGTFHAGESDFTLDLAGIQAVLNQLQQSVSAIMATDGGGGVGPGPGGPGNPGGPGSPPLPGCCGVIERRLNNISATCNGNGTITITV